MTGKTDSGSSNMTCDDEDFVSCQICFINFDEVDRIPKYLEKCYHFFCLPCIKDLIGPLGKKKVLCPVCRVSSTMSNRKCGELVTNHVALRLLKVVESQAKANKEKIVKQWCSECKSSGSVACQQNKHELKNYPEAFNEQSLQLNSKINEQHLACNKILEDCHKIQSVNQLVISCTNWLQSEFSHRNASNNIVMSQIDSLKSCKDFSIHMEEDMVKTLTAIEELKIKFSSRMEDIKATGSKVLDILNLLAHAQQESEYLAQLSTDVSPTDLDTWLKMLNSSNLETGKKQNSLKLCVRMLAFVFTLLSGELHNTDSTSVSSNSSTSKVDSENGDAIKKERGQSENEEPLPSCSGMQTSKRMSEDYSEDASVCKKSRGPSPSKIITEICQETVSSNQSKKMCFLRFLINGEPSERVIFNLNHDIAPNMTSKFIEFCTGTLAAPGYLGSEVFPHQMITKEMPALKGIPSLRGGQIVDYENFLFIADVLTVPAKLGSILFTVKEENGTIVSPDFQILLADPQSDSSVANTIFGHVVVGFNVLDRIRKMHSESVQIPLSTDYVTIVECGVI